MYEHRWIDVEALLVGRSLQGVVSADQLQRWAAEKNSRLHPEQWILDQPHCPPRCHLRFPQNSNQNCWIVIDVIGLLPQMFGHRIMCVPMIGTIKRLV